MIEQPNDVTDVEKEIALDCLTAGIEAAKPSSVLGKRLTCYGSELEVDGDRYDLAAYEHAFVVGGGKAAGTAAVALEEVLGTWVDRGAVVTDTHADTDRIDVLLGDHPVPSERGVESTRTMLEVAEAAGPGDLVIVVITGGGSALLPAPAEGIELPELQSTTEGLLASGASIDEINSVRKHCSDLKGGQLAAIASPATVLGIVFSDVVANRLEVIASGPLTPDDSTFDDAINVLQRYEIDVPTAVKRRLEQGDNGTIPETPSPGDPVFESVHQYVLADSHTAMEGAAEAARDAGYKPLILSSRIRGEAKEVAKTLTGIAEECVDTGTPISPPAVLLSGGETTVTIRGSGVGGPNSEFVLSAALAMSEIPLTVAAVDTDGIDGNAEAAGGVATRATAEPKREARTALQNNDSGSFLGEKEALIRTGPTGTNANDLRAFVLSAQ